MELTEKMYYACGKCGKHSKPQWHRPRTEIWHKHKEYIDLDETNSDRPSYFWCTRCNKPHNDEPECLKHKAQITYNGKAGSYNKPTSHKSHGDVLSDIQKYVSEHSDVVNWKDVVGTTNLPWPCKHETALVRPDIIYCEPDKFMKFRHSITNVIEFETATSAPGIANKVERFNDSSRQMIENKAQSEVELQRIIFLYDRQTRVSLEKVRRAVQSVRTEYLDRVVVGYYDEEGDWFEQWFKG